MARFNVACCFLQFKRHFSRLTEVGRFQVPKSQGTYEAGQSLPEGWSCTIGLKVPYKEYMQSISKELECTAHTAQLFLHKIFGYRGVLLFPWVARLYDRDREALENEKDFEETPSNISNINKELKPESKTYYQALIDTRDSPFIRAQPEIVTFLGHESDNALYTIPGLDYVSHDDVLPYIISDPFSKPISHELFDKFLAPEPGRVPPYTCKDALQAWQEKNYRWLELTDVHRETTNHVRVTVVPFFMGIKNVQPSPSYWWRYSIRLENLGPETVQLRERHWRIFSLSGTLETVRGRGVVGQEPVLSSQQPAFQYSSHVSLQASSGHMWGTFRMERPEGSTFDVRIPPFSLESKEEEASPVI